MALFIPGVSPAATPGPTLSSLRRYENRLSTPLLWVKGVVGIGIGQTRTGNNRLDIVLARRSATVQSQVKALMMVKALKLPPKAVRFVVTGIMRPE